LSSTFPTLLIISVTLRHTITLHPNTEDWLLVILST